REESSCWVTTDQSPFVLGLMEENGPLLLEQKLQVTEGSKTRERHLFLFRDVLVFAKLKSTASYRLKHRVNLEEAWLFGFDSELEEELPSDLDSDLDLGLSLVLAWDLAVCLLTFGVLSLLFHCYRNICDAKAHAGGECTLSDGHMKVLTGNIAVKSLSGGGMEHLIELPVQGECLPPVPLFMCCSPVLIFIIYDHFGCTENRWRGVVRRLKSGSSFIYKKKQLFGRPLSKLCPGEGCLPKAILDILVLLRKRGPSTEGAFRKSCNNKKMQEVREQLESGADVLLGEQPVVLLVGLLKSFLKELPGSLLDTQLYERWMRSFNQEEPQQRAEELKRVLEDLPRPNVVLLQYLLCVLYHIQQNSHSNKMSAPNLAVCIGPTLLWSAGTPLDEQPDRMKEVADLTQFLIEHWEIVGDNIPHLLDTDEDSASSQHHDSAYDSTDPDGDIEQADSTTGDSESPRNFSSLSNITQESSSPLTCKASVTRRCSEPILCLSADSPGLRWHAWSRDDCSMATRFFREQPLIKQSSDDAILSRRINPSFSQDNMEALLCHSTNRIRECSCSSLDSAASNQSEGSVFTSSPMGSPTCLRKPSSTQFNQEKLEDKKRSMKVLLRARSFNRISLKRADLQSESTYPCETLQEDLQSEATSPKPRPLSAIEVFKHIDSRLLCEPPSYQQAVQNIGLPPEYRAMTVQDAIQLDRRSRPSSVNYDWPTAGHVVRERVGMDVGLERVERVERVDRRPRAMSESVPAGRSDALLRRCSHPLFEEFSNAKESYV
ncbi:hypothetical protein NQD34_017515, partial [Periophthalmus magnuspinnatus]